MTPGGAYKADELTVREIAGMLNQQAARLAPQLLPNGRKEGPYWCVGSVEGEPGQTMKVHLSGSKIGKWSDYARDPGERGGTGDMLTIVELSMHEGDKAAAVKWAKGYLGIGQGLDPGMLERQRARANETRRRSEADQATADEKRRRNSERLWQGAIELHRAPPALDYFKGRGIDFAALGRIPRAMRFRGDVRHFETKKQYPAILSAMIGPDGKHRATHATFIERTPAGRWIKLRDVASAKLIFGTPTGAHIPLQKGRHRHTLRDIPAGTPVEAAEGIENALSVALAFPQARILAGGTLGLLGTMILPPQAGDFTLLADNDPPGSDAADLLEKKIAMQQLAAKRDGSNRKVMLRWPAEGYKDFNDQLQGKRIGA